MIVFFVFCFLFYLTMFSFGKGAGTGCDFVTCTVTTPVAQSAPRNLLTRWDVSSIPANGIFLTKN